MTSRYRVMHVVHGLDVGGLEVMLNRMVKRLDASRFQSMMCCFDVRGSLADDFEEAGFRGQRQPLEVGRPNFIWVTILPLGNFLRVVQVP